MTALFVHLSLAASAFLSSTLLPGTSEVALLALVAQWPGSTITLLTVATLANTAGSAVNYALGRGAMHYADRPWFPVSKANIDKAATLYNRFGLWSLLFAWLPIVGDPLTLAAGMLRVRLLPFLILVMAGKFVRYAVLVAGFLSV
jgi:membrane protein YqaA with SNARE-associated domain